MDELLTSFSEGAEEFFGEDLLLEKIKEGKTLVIKAGFDPTSPDLHLGHYVLIKKLASLQKLGHEVVFVVGDFTAMVGDPSGKDITRKQLTRQEVLDNSETYQEQVFKILDKEKTKIVFNSEWLDKISSSDFIKLTACSTVARMLERDSFSKRFKNNDSISLHEFIYPLLQGYDSVILKSDLEVGGTDQIFNLLMGRELQKKYNQKERQAVLTLPILEGLDGIKKMSKSLNNYIGFKDLPENMFGKVMSINDELMLKYFSLVLGKNSQYIENLKSTIKDGKNPKEIKIELATKITEIFHNKELAQQAKESFNSRFALKKTPAEMDLQIISSDSVGGTPLLGKVIVFLNFVDSNSKAMRLIKQGAVKINGSQIKDTKYILGFDEEIFLQVGKLHIAKIILSK